MYSNSLQSIAQVTSDPGVYLFLDSNQRILYIGKAKNLKKRLLSYYGKQLSLKTQVLMPQVKLIDINVTDSEQSALLLEARLIKEHSPKYNILLKDDKSYPYIAVSLGHRYPSIDIFRGKKKRKGTRYFGPYPNSGAARRTVSFLQKNFLVRSCRDSFFSSRSRPCLQYQIKRCSAPCVDYISVQNYHAAIDKVLLFLNANNKQLIKTLQEDMHQFSIDKCYEQAAKVRDLVQDLRSIPDKHFSQASMKSIDVISLVKNKQAVCIHITMIRANRSLGSRVYYYKVLEGSSELEIINAFFSQHYLHGNQFTSPDAFLLNVSFEDYRLWEVTLSQLFNKSIKIYQRHNAAQKKWLLTNNETALMKLKQHCNSLDILNYKLQALTGFLTLKKPIQQIACVDVSHTFGEATVGSYVVFNDTGAVKSLYRRYKINSITPGDDYAALSELLQKKFNTASNKVSSAPGHYPDVLLIDGGKGQVNKVKHIVPEGIVVLGISKGAARKVGQEKIILNYGQDTIKLNEHSDILHLLQQVRDEAHRFAITGHRQQRSKARVTSRVEQIKGIGKKRRFMLLSHFGGLKGLQDATIMEIAAVPGINIKLAKVIHKAISKNKHHEN